MHALFFHLRQDLLQDLLGRFYLQGILTVYAQLPDQLKIGENLDSSRASVLKEMCLTFPWTQIANLTGK